uniref:Transposase (Putative), gypsy type n=1 Tax=Tanacetum cinerariifolium TaxID=118510 RepID=A0A6L2MZ47_TANCI|nr:hypothetical protein [Tanacetum cinerariifolium]
MGRDTVQLETAVSTISQEHLLEFTSECGISEALHPKLPVQGKGSWISPKARLVDERVFSTIVDWRTSTLKDEMPAENTYSPEAMMVLNTHRTPIQKQLEALLCLVGLSRRYFLGDELYTTVKTGTHPRAAHEVPLLTVTTSRVIEMEDPATETDSSGANGLEDQGQEAVAPEVPPLENVTTTGVGPEAGQTKGIAATGPHSTHRGKSLTAMGLGMGSTRPVLASQGALVDVSDPDPLSFADPQALPTADVSQYSKGAAIAEDPKSENTSFTSMVGSPESIYRPEWGVTNGCLLVASEAYHHAQVARRDKRIQARENEIKNLETLLEAKTDIKKITEGKSAELSKELENLRALVSDLQVSNDRLSQHVSTLQAQVTGEEKLKAVFKEFKQYEDNQVEQRCHRWVIRHGLRLAVMKCGESTELRQVFADVMSAGIAKGMSEGLKYGVEHGKANLSLEAIEAYDPEAEDKYITALHALKDLKYPMVDQLESLKDALIDVIMASLHLESDTGDDAPQWIHELRPSSSQLTIPVCLEVRDPIDLWACKEEILLEDAIAANVSRVEKKKKFRVVCRIHVVGSAHHARSDGVPVSVPTVAPQGLAILLADATTQTEISEDRASLRLLRFSSLPVMHN